MPPARRSGTSGYRARRPEKLARFLLSVIPSLSEPGEENGPVRATFTLTHEEIAEVIGSSRETVTRLFAKFKRKKLVEVHGSTLVITNRAGLRTILEGGSR